jgi:hypothetical protein
MLYVNAVGPEMECDSDEVEGGGEHDKESRSPMCRELNKLGIQMAHGGGKQ